MRTWTSYAGIGLPLRAYTLGLVLSGCATTSYFGAGLIERTYTLGVVFPGRA